MSIKELKITDIKVGHRHRKDMGDLTSLADSIRQDGFLQPIGVTEKLELVFGERRLRAHKDILKKKTILARIVDVPSIIAGEYAENEIRKDFTPSERVAIAKAIEKQVGKRQGQRTDKLRGKIPEVVPGKRTRETAANKAGFGNDKTYRQAAKVVENGTARLIQAMDSGRVSISAASILADADAEEQESILELDEKAILQAAKEIRQHQTAARNHRQHEAENTARGERNGKKTWTITSNQKVIQCDLLIADPPYKITKEPWEPDDLEAFTRQWCRKWSVCGADFKLFDHQWLRPAGGNAQRDRVPVADQQRGRQLQQQRPVPSERAIVGAAETAIDRAAVEEHRMVLLDRFGEQRDPATFELRGIEAEPQPQRFLGPVRRRRKFEQLARGDRVPLPAGCGWQGGIGKDHLRAVERHLAGPVARILGG